MARVTACSKCLYEAVFFKRTDLIERILDAGVSAMGCVSENPDGGDFSPPWERKPGHMLPYTTPDATAIRTQNFEAISLFDNRSTTNETCRSSLTNLVAAAEIGSLGMLERYLGSDGSSSDELGYFLEDGRACALNDALYRAIANGHEDIVTLLLRAGAEPTMDLFKVTIESRDHEMITFLVTNARRLPHGDFVLAAAQFGDEGCNRPS